MARGGARLARWGLVLSPVNPLFTPLAQHRRIASHQQVASGWLRVAPHRSFGASAPAQSHPRQQPPTCLRQDSRHTLRRFAERMIGSPRSQPQRSDMKLMRPHPEAAPLGTRMQQQGGLETQIALIGGRAAHQEAMVIGNEQSIGSGALAASIEKESKSGIQRRGAVSAAFVHDESLRSSASPRNYLAVISPLSQAPVRPCKLASASTPRRKSTLLTPRNPIVSTRATSVPPTPRRRSQRETGSPASAATPCKRKNPS